MTDVFTLRGPVKKDRPEPAKRNVTRKSLDGTELGSVALEPTIFGIEPNMAVLHQVIKAQLAAKRSGTQSTKTRKEVRGGGKKPFNQKGTGGARQGTIRAPHYPGGGIALGPKPRKYDQKTPKKMIRLALYSALSDRAAMERVAV
ncbi:MAG: 50S ribosomal protein L4, partial [Acidimicrobiales bacterium]